MADPLYDVTIRHFLCALLGARVVEITQHDRDEWEETGQSVIDLHFDTGLTVEIAGDLVIADPAQGRTRLTTGASNDDEETPCDG